MSWRITMEIAGPGPRAGTRDPELVIQGERVIFRLHNTVRGHQERAIHRENWTHVPELWVTGSRTVGPVPAYRDDPLRFGFRFDNDPGIKRLEFIGTPRVFTVEDDLDADLGPEEHWRRPGGPSNIEAAPEGSLVFDLLQETMEVHVVPSHSSAARLSRPPSRPVPSATVQGRSSRSGRRLDQIESERERAAGRARAAREADWRSRLARARRIRLQRMTERAGTLSPEGVIAFEFWGATDLRFGREEDEVVEYYHRLRAHLEVTPPLRLAPRHHVDHLRQRRADFRWHAQLRGDRVEFYEVPLGVPDRDVAEHRRTHTHRYRASDVLKVELSAGEGPAIIRADEAAQALFVGEIMDILTVVDIVTMVFVPIGGFIGGGLRRLAAWLARPAHRALVRESVASTGRQAVRRSARGTTHAGLSRRYSRARAGRSRAERQLADRQRTRALHSRSTGSAARATAHGAGGRPAIEGISEAAARYRTRAHRRAVRRAVLVRRAEAHRATLLTDDDRRSAAGMFREWAIDRILEDAAHPLLPLLDEATGNFVSSMSGHWEVLHRTESPQMGHLLARVLRPDEERMALQWAYSNQVQSIAERRARSAARRGLSHAGEYRDALLRQALDIDGVPVEADFVELLEARRILPPGTTANARPHPGWLPDHWTVVGTGRAGRWQWRRRRMMP